LGGVFAVIFPPPPPPSSICAWPDGLRQVQTFRTPLHLPVQLLAPCLCLTHSTPEAPTCLAPTYHFLPPNIPLCAAHIQTSAFFQRSHFHTLDARLLTHLPTHRHASASAAPTGRTTRLPPNTDRCTRDSDGAVDLGRQAHGRYCCLTRHCLPSPGGSVSFAPTLDSSALALPVVCMAFDACLQAAA